MKKLILGIIAILNIYIVDGQVMQEYEVDAGYAIFQGDYGVRKNFTSTWGNTGFLVSGKAYFNLLKYESYNCYACKHIKFPLTFNIGYSDLNFDYANYSNSTPEGIKINAFRGSVFHTSLSFGFEYHLGDLTRIRLGYSSIFSKFDPYFGAGIGGAVYVVRLKSDLGDYKSNPNILPVAFQGGVYDEPGLVPAFNFETGLRYKLSETLQIVGNVKWIYFLSDKVDGLVPNPKIVDNIYSDWLFAPSIGFIFRSRTRDFFCR